MAINQKQAAKQFVERWKTEEGNEDRQSRSFWIELTNKVLGIDDPTHVLEFERKAQGRKMDVFYEDMGILIEQKSRGVGLDKKSERSKQAGEETPYQQAKWYADHLPNSVRPDWIIVSNFDEFRIHSLNSENPEKEYVSFTLDELPDQVHLLSFFTDKSSSRLVKEKELSVKAGEIVGRLYKSLAAQYKNIETDKHEQRSLNILIVRFVFLLYAEDAGILQEHQAFLNYMRKVEPEDMRTALIQLFEVLDTPEDQRDPYLPEKLAAFPYINGSLFSKEDIVIPQFTQQIKYDLLKEASQEFDWSGISPTIFGAAFESTLNPETRREGGMHYTSIENIHKVIDPLFLDDLRAELAKIEGLKVEKTRNLQLRQFQNKLASIKIFDPACGSGNFLTESYLSLRKLENRVLENLMGDQMGMAFEGDTNPIKVKIDQFYGIEINDFAVAVAKTALWIAEEQMMDVTQEILFTVLEFLPLSSNDNIHEGNALRMDWNSILPAEQCSFIIGNPPFISQGSTDKGQASGPGQNVVRTKEQNEDMSLVFKDINNYGCLDYVSAWYVKSMKYMKGNQKIECAFVSTNSIVQGQQVEPLWSYLLSLGINILFAHQSFIWINEARDNAIVYVVIIGFSLCDKPKKKLFIYSDYKEVESINTVEHINPYLVANDDLIITSRRKPISEVPTMLKGNAPGDGGNLLLSPDDMHALIKNEPESEIWIKRFISADGLLNNKEKYCLWLDGITQRQLESLPLVNERVSKVRAMRIKSTKAATRKKAETAWLFDENRMGQSEQVIVIPRHSTSIRRYVPMTYFDGGCIPGDSCSMIPDAPLYIFGILMSQFHNAWVRVVAGRFGPSLRYSNTICYNNFVFPSSTPEQKQKIEQLAQEILDIRDSYPDASLADLYDPDKMPSDLLEAHKSLDRAVEEAYGVDFNGDEEKIVSHLFKLYAEATKDL